MDEEQPADEEEPAAPARAPAEEAGPALDAGEIAALDPGLKKVLDRFPGKLKKI